MLSNDDLAMQRIDGAINLKIKEFESYAVRTLELFSRFSERIPWMEQDAKETAIRNKGVH